MALPLQASIVILSCLFCLRGITAPESGAVIVSDGGGGGIVVVLRREAENIKKNEHSRMGSKGIDPEKIR
jgi:hypothetical protein